MRIGVMPLLLTAACTTAKTTPTVSAASRSPAAAAAEVEDTDATATIQPAAPTRLPLGAAPAPTSEAAAITLAAQDAASDPQGSDARYFSLVHAKSVGLSVAQLMTTRLAVNKLMNSLAWSANLALPSAIDDAGLLLKIHLKDYGWSPALWDSLVTAYPQTSANAAEEVPGLNNLLERTATTKPVLRAEWFISNVSLPPLYYQALQMPTSFNQLQQMIPVDIGADVRSNAVMRAGFDNSIVSANDRVIERHTLANSRFLWRSYEFGSKTGDQNIFQAPLGPVRYFSGADSGPNNAAAVLGPSSTQFSDNGGEVYFSLPNGMLAFYITDGSDQRLSSVPGAAHGPIFAGGVCMSCHVHGPINKTDMVEPAIGTSSTGNIFAFSAADFATVAKLYVTPSVFTSQVTRDNAVYQQGLAKLGIGAGDADPVSAVVGLNISENP